ncbi:hypothetical protein JXA88_03370 [Candidatus Fermentibacteria bacterium]|nr:hypothetical protein [Candidatus Fermentibacteria bacterium]
MQQPLAGLVSLIAVLLVPSVGIAQGHGDMFGICVESHEQGWPQVCYNPLADEYLAVWEDYRGAGSDIYGQFIDGDGSLRGEDIPICASAGHQYWPRLDFDPSTARYLIVFEDWRNAPDGDIRGVFLNADGSFFDTPTSEGDHTFGICTNASAIYTCAVAFNPESHRYLVVWGDFRNDPTGQSFTGADVFGQMVGADGTLMSPADPAVNFPVANHPDILESVADVTFCMGTMEWLVAYGTAAGCVMAQRVSATGALIDRDGAVTTVPAPLVVSAQFQNGPDCFQARVKANCQGLACIPDWHECEVVWKGLAEGFTDNDVWGQRIGFVNEAGAWVAKYVAADGTVTENVSNHAISIQADWVGPADIDFSVQDNEFLVAWGDPRTQGLAGQDLYYQRLWVDVSQGGQMVWLDDDRVNTVEETENIPVFTTPAYEGSLLGIAHSTARNEFLVAFTYVPEGAQTGDIMGVIASGSPPVAADDKPVVAERIWLEPFRPNPFDHTTAVRFAIPREGRVTVTVSDLVGHAVATLSDGVRPAGAHTVSWDGTNGAGVPVGAGVYVCSVRCDDRVETRRVALIR